MRKLYINSSGRLRRKDNTLFFETELDGERVRKFIPIEDTEAIYLFGEVEVNSRVLGYLAEYGIPLHLFNYHGYYTGSFLPRKRNVSGYLVVEQVKHYLDLRKRLYLASSFVEGAIYNMHRNLKKRGKDLSDKLPNFEEVESVEELMALEGNFREAYYRAFNQLIEKEEFSFLKRTRRPPADPLNALISFGNSLLYATVLGEIYRTALDPSVSYLHSPSERRFSLALDISEIFKPLVVDPVILNLVNTGEITLEDFDKRFNYAHLNERGRTKFIKAFEEKLGSTVKHRKLKRNVSLQQLIRMECYKLVKHLIGDETYVPLKAWW
ncbi:MAG: type I-B CRISPR-associated endonuclease Cas1 [Aquificae bacterium]|nr:type I-B CRISPR-associated endonuclease Cas1 [Aquificota bacterium]